MSTFVKKTLQKIIEEFNDENNKKIKWVFIRPCETA